MREPVEARWTSRVPNVSEMGLHDAFDATIRWWFANFQPADTSHAEYFAHWGGPHYVREELRFAFGSSIGDLTLDWAVMHIEQRGTKWAPSKSRLRGERAC